MDLMHTWASFTDCLHLNADRLDALREYAQVFFLHGLNVICLEKGWDFDQPQYVHRPPLGLRLEHVAEGLDMVLALRPHWAPGRRRLDEAKQPGTVDAARLDVEVMALERRSMLHV